MNGTVRGCPDERIEVFPERDGRYDSSYLAQGLFLAGGPLGWIHSWLADLVPIDLGGGKHLSYVPFRAVTSRMLQVRVHGAHVRAHEPVFVPQPRRIKPCFREGQPQRNCRVNFCIANAANFATLADDRCALDRRLIWYRPFPRRALNIGRRYIGRATITCARPLDSRCSGHYLYPRGPRSLRACHSPPCSRPA